MKALNKSFAILLMSVAGASFAGPAFAADAVSSDWGSVVVLQSGWTVDRMLVFHSAPMKNPENCSLVTNGYIIDENAPAHKTFYAMLLGGQLNSKEISFVIQGCFENRPRIVSVSIR